MHTISPADADGYSRHVYVHGQQVQGQVRMHCEVGLQATAVTDHPLMAVTGHNPSGHKPPRSEFPVQW